ncbi:class 1 fructose-bisphosphatase [Mesorhizobium sp. 1M-11]|uniref:class 1 fructose-bisphosphatase n=1 Tax=Mesorhizobium sp. 1M-11 TaxID=1529006 RepID=UPI0006C756EC|nr:class 1 fructose-bisphosphatase [Mesorhizobium sp. 1M-11]
MSASTLDAYLNSVSLDPQSGNARLSDVVRRLAEAATRLKALVSQPTAGSLGAASGKRNSDGDIQRHLDVSADEEFLAAARQAGVRHYCSEELESAVDLNGESTLALSIDPLDGSSNIDANVSIGTIFSILPARDEPATSFLQPGRNQLAAGFFIYGPQFALALTLGGGTRIFVHSSRLGTFVETARLNIPDRTQEFAINASNYRHWDEAVRLYVDDCLKGSTGPRKKDFNMRWIASLAAEAFRILTRGGVFLYPGDARKGYARGRLRLVYEANPIAMLIEQAGGAATDGINPILDLGPSALHQRTALVFGSAREVERIARYHTDPSVIAERSPLFGNRGLFRA